MEQKERLALLRGDAKRSRVNVEAAITAVNNSKLSFAEKVKQVEALEDLASGYELELFSEVYSSLRHMAETDADHKLLSGAE